MVSGSIFFICWLSWISRCFLAAIFFQTESRVSCPRELKKVLRKRGRQWRNRDQWILVSRNLPSAKNDPPQDLSDPNSLGTRELDQSCVSSRDRKLTGNINPNPTMYSQERQTRLHSIFQHQETRAERWISKTQPAPGNWAREGRISNSEGRSYTSTICRSPIIGTLRKSSRICRKSWISKKTHHQLVSKRWRPTYWSGDCLCRLRWKPPFILDQITLKIWIFTGTRTSRNYRICSIYLEVDIESSSRDSESENDWLDISFMDEICTFLVIKRSRGRKREYMSTRIPSYAWMKMSDHAEANRRLEKSGNGISTFRFLQRITWNWWRTDWVRVEYSPGLTSLEILQKIQKDLQDRNIEPKNFEDRIIFMFSDIEWTKKGKFRTMYFIFGKRSRITRRDSREDTGHSLALETKRNGMELSVKHLKENGIPPPHKRWNDSKRRIIQ